MKVSNDPKGDRASLRPSYFLNRIGGPTPMFLEAGADGGGDGGEGGDKSDGKKADGDVYTKEQMEAFRDTHMANARRKWEKEKAELEKNWYTKLGLTGPEEIEKLNHLREEAEKVERQKELDKGNFEKALAEREKKFHEKESEYQNQIATKDTAYDALVKRINLTEAALKAGADPMNVDMVVAFTQSGVKVVDERTLQPVGTDGNPLFDPDKAKEMSLDDFMKSFLNSRPSLLKSSGTAGAGSKPGGKSGQYSVEDINHLAKTDLKKYKELKEQGVVDEVLGKALGT